MTIDYKKIHIGKHLKSVSELQNLSLERASNFLKCSKEQIHEMYTLETLDVNLLLRWCKLLDYNFFMLYHSHLQLYKPSASTTKLYEGIDYSKRKPYENRKNFYNPDIIKWLLHLVETKEYTMQEIMNKYCIPKTTLYRWRKRDTEKGKENQN